MKTKAEILDEFGCPTPDFTKNVTMYYPAIHSAMEEYAQQQAQEFAEWGLQYTFDAKSRKWQHYDLSEPQFTTSELYAKFQEESWQK